MAAFALLVASAAGAQRPDSSAAHEASYVVKTLPLHRLSNMDAVLLLQPYLIGKGSASATGPSIRAVTVRAAPKTIAEMEKLLEQYDRTEATVSLQFQLVAADYSTNRDPALAGVDSVLRGVLKFTGYRVMSSTIANVGEETSARVTLSGDGEDYAVIYGVGRVNVDTRSIQMQVDLRRSRLVMQAGGVGSGDKSLLSTGVTIPDDHTVVLGGAVEALARPDRGNRNERAIFLVVRAQITSSTKKD
jgi:hypothetical protein